MSSSDARLLGRRRGGLGVRRWWAAAASVVSGRVSVSTTVTVSRGAVVSTVTVSRSRVVSGSSADVSGGAVSVVAGASSVVGAASVCVRSLRSGRVSGTDTSVRVDRQVGQGAPAVAAPARGQREREEHGGGAHAAAVRGARERPEPSGNATPRPRPVVGAAPIHPGEAAPGS